MNDLDTTQARLEASLVHMALTGGLLGACLAATAITVLAWDGDVTRAAVLTVGVAWGIVVFAQRRIRRVL